MASIWEGQATALGQGTYLSEFGFYNNGGVPSSPVVFWTSSGTYLYGNTTHTTPTPTPEPATMLLFGTGLAGLAGWRKRRNSQGIGS